MAQEIVPLSRKQNIVLLVIIACIFQFVLFYAPALADEAVNKVNTQSNDSDIIITTDSMVKESSMGSEAAKFAKPVIATSSNFRVVNTSAHTITAYNSEAGQTDDSPCITANGYNVCIGEIEDTIAANFLKFGTKVKIPDLYGDRIFIVRDRMNVKHANRVDIWMKDRTSAVKFGVKTAKIQVIE